MPDTIDLVGPKGYVHGWKYVGGGKPPSGKMSSSRGGDTRAAKAELSKGTEDMAPEDRADAASMKIFKGGAAAQTVANHRAAAGLHRTAANLSSVPSVVAHHQKMASIHAELAAHLAKSGSTIQAANELARSIQLASPTSTAGRKSLAKQNLALPDGSFPVPNAGYWDKARQAVGRVKDPAKRAAVAKLLRKTAKRYGKTAALQNSWAAPGGNQDHSNPTELSMPTHQPIRTPSDLLIARGEGGVAIIRHRTGGGAEIGRIRREGSGWLASIDGRDLPPRNHQRTALADIIGTHNRGALTEHHRPSSAEPALQPPAQQTPLMAQYGVPAIRALATPTNGASDGPQMTSNSAGTSDDSGDNGLTPKGKAIYAKLIKRGFPAARALAFAKRAQNMGAK